ncbi:MAG TPA: hypothetical protein VG756_25885 [Pseudonocardiaceae bacterium]|jgi:hypothetical protein|nr:hypothetical protein [Pseudonocardiaceae bacterium]
MEPQITVRGRAGESAPERSPRPRSTAWTVSLVLGRLAGAGLLGAMAGIHIYLYFDGYSSVSLIGPLFMINGVVGGLLMIAVLVSPGRFLSLVAGLSCLFDLGTLAALILSLTVGLFGFDESLVTPLVPTTLIVESIGVVALAVLVVLNQWSRRSLTVGH